MLAPGPGQRILDLGCGDGALTEKIAASGADVVGLDASASQVEAARARGLEARLGDGTGLDFESEFDAVFSNAALHWMTPPEAVVAGINRALKPGGRLVAEFGGAGNVARIEAALMKALERRGFDAAAANPWYFPGPDDYTALLTGQGFRVDSIALIPRPTPLAAGLAGWLETFSEPFTELLEPARRAEYLAEVTEDVRPELCDAEGNWSADYVRLRLAATLEG
jgi:SAM-dependent methyltransferase